MRILIIKTSSMGDIIHTLPALTDAGKIYPDIKFDWVVEESFAEIPTWHPLVNKVIPVALRRWRKNIWQAIRSGEWQKFYRELRAEKYDYVIDAQGLIKSGFITFFTRGLKCGYDRHSVWEPLACLTYQNTASVNPEQHAVDRVRQLFAKILKYELTEKTPHYGIDLNRLPTPTQENEYVVFLHGTTWSTKHWPENYWAALLKQVNNAGYKVLLLWGNQIEQERATRLAQNNIAQVMPKLKLAEIATLIAHAKAIVAVDTGLGHLAAALHAPTISLYGPTNSALTGTMGPNQIHISAEFSCSPCLSKNCNYNKPAAVFPACFNTVSPSRVWTQLESILI